MTENTFYRKYPDAKIYCIHCEKTFLNKLVNRIRTTDLNNKKCYRYHCPFCGAGGYGFDLWPSEKLMDEINT